MKFVFSLSKSSAATSFGGAHIPVCHGRIYSSTRYLALQFLAILTLLLLLTSCKKSPDISTSSTGPTNVKLALNWKPEPEFGGFYAADLIGAYQSRNLRVDITGGGEQVAQMLGAAQVEFGILSAEEVVIARSKDIDLVALFAVYQTNPQGIMTHAARNFASIADVFSHEGTLAVQPGLTYVKFLQKQFPNPKVKIVPYDYSISQFMTDPKHSQQCFVTSEPLSAKRKGGDLQVFPIATTGFNPYATVVVTNGNYLRAHPNTVRKFCDAVREGWRAYINDPKPANAAMQKLNPEMDAEMFTAAADAQKPMIATGPAGMEMIGAMQEGPWQQLIPQLIDLKVITKAPKPEECFTNVGEPKPSPSIPQKNVYPPGIK